MRRKKNGGDSRAVVAGKLVKMNKCANLHLVRHVFICIRCIITSCLQSSSVLEKIKAVGSLPHLSVIKATSKNPKYITDIKNKDNH